MMYPKIGIRPVIDGRWGGIRESLEAQTMGMAHAAKALIETLKYPDGTPVQVVVSPFTIGGGTYAREFKKGASFGVNMPWIENPDWVGGEHGPDEGVSEELLKTSFKIYVLALAELQGLEIQ